MTKREMKAKLYHARAQIGKAVIDIRAAKAGTDNGAHKHLCEQIILLTDVMHSLSPTDPHLDLE